MKNLRKFILALILMGIVFSSLHLSLYGLTPKPLPGYEDLKAAVAPYGWKIHDVIIRDGRVSCWYFYEEGSFASDDTQWANGFYEFMSWMNGLEPRPNIFILVNIYEAEALTPDFKSTTYLVNGLYFAWWVATFRDMMGEVLYELDPIRVYMLQPSEFLTWGHIINFTYQAYFYGCGTMGFAGAPWEPDEDGLWAHLIPAEKSVESYPAHN